MAKNNRTNKSKKKQPASKRTVIIVSICCAVTVLLIGLIIGMVVYLNRDKQDDRILDNVCAGGINLGGLTVEEAKNALQLGAGVNFKQTSMVITLPDASIILSPDKTGARLDVDGVVQEAYQYGRTGTEEEREAIRKQSATTIHTIALLPYLNLNLPYIQNTIKDFCQSYSSSLTQPKIEISGKRPTYDPEKPGASVTHQTLTITMGTPKYELRADALYNDVLDAYSLNDLDLTYQAPTLTEPSKPNAADIFTQYCVYAEDATIDDITFVVTPEVYGYGFDIETVQKLIDSATYGQKIPLTLNFIMPRITAKDLTKDLFLDMIASGLTATNIGAAWNNNLKLSCQAINNYVIKAGEEFSFNLVLGRPSADKGYQKAPGYRGGKDMDVMGSGISQTASTLYYCVLMADLQVLERHSSGFAPKYTENGLDACINWGSQDLRFVNNTSSPIRIVAVAEGGSVSIQLYGIDEREYDVQLRTQTTAETAPRTIYQVWDKNNAPQYSDGHVLQSGITGCDVDTYVLKYNKQTGALLSNIKIHTSHYSSRDLILVKLAEGSGISEVLIPTTRPSTVPTTAPSTSAA